jgi:hypothetical protein
MLKTLAPLSLGALLLFLIQPLMAKAILPVHGGAASVWTACLVFYQCGLLSGYLYAFLLSQIALRWQLVIHSLLMVASIFTLPIHSPMELELKGGGPETEILLGLLRSIGLPYLLLASTSPLLQSWDSRQSADPRVFRWFAISNLGSLLGLLAYPFAIEPFSHLAQQQLGWMIAYVMYLVLLAFTMCIQLVRGQSPATSPHSPEVAPILPMSTWSIPRALLSVTLAACSTIVLGASTSQMSQSGVVVPFLWVLPLTLYLASFIVCFQWAALSKPTFWIRIYWVSCYLACALLFWGLLFPIPWQIAGYSVLVLACSMACHAQLHALRPPARFLTHYYLFIALGGAMGGAFTGLLAPRLFTDYWEFHLGLGLTAILLAMCELVRLLPRFRKERYARNVLFPATFLPVFFIVTLLYVHVEAIRNEPVVERQRDFFGVVSVLDKPDTNQRLMLHGKTQHGMQPLKGAASAESTLYFTPDAGVAKAIAWRRDKLSRPLRLGVIGLGTGSLLTHAKVGDQVTFYEISPAVDSLARKHFSYLSDHQGEVSVAIGDGRQLLSKEWKERGSRQFDVLVIDAFSGDALPTHLLTLEAIKLYQSHLAKDGAIAFQITNRYLDLAPILSAAAQESNCNAVILETDPPSDRQGSQVRWAIFLPKALAPNDSPSWEKTAAKPVKIVAPWTDDFGSLWSALR